jgi:hypothetical protein
LPVYCNGPVFDFDESLFGQTGVAETNVAQAHRLIVLLAIAIGLAGIVGLWLFGFLIAGKYLF